MICGIIIFEKNRTEILDMKKKNVILWSLFRAYFRIARKTNGPIWIEEIS